MCLEWGLGRVLTSYSNGTSLVAKVVEEDRVQDGCIGCLVHIDSSSIRLVVVDEATVVKDNYAVLQNDGGLAKGCQVGERAIHNGEVLVGDGDGSLR